MSQLVARVVLSALATNQPVRQTLKYPPVSTEDIHKSSAMAYL